MSFIIGIDLGTTNSTFSSISLEEESFKIRQHSIPQIDADGNERDLLQLPSSLLFPMAGEWKEPYIVGQYAKERGGELPHRVIHSAKSWLSCFNMNRRERFLPIVRDDEDIHPLSPIDVSAAFLKVIKMAWQKVEPDAPFAEQKVLVTVPASFDPSARALVLEAARNADFPEVTLIEEPLAAFYAWLGANETNWREKLKIGDRVLIVDIGGGTSDFTLITVSDNAGELALERRAVGPHLLLGGDNIDLALAYHVKGKLETEGRSLDHWQFQSLIMQARKVKELLLSDDAPPAATFLIDRKGSSLIGGSIATTLTQEEVYALLVEGFFPLLGLEEKVLETRGPISKLGLPFARDARITAHLAAFLNHSCQGELPTKVLFNGGTMKSSAFQKRILEQLNSWIGPTGSPIHLLEGADLDFSVSKGAVFYRWSKEKSGIRVKAGTTSGYFIGIEGAAPAVPGKPSPLHALCIAPFGMEEGSEVFLEETFTLAVGELAEFQFFSSDSPFLTDGSSVDLGRVVEEIGSELRELHPIVAHLSAEGIEGTTVNIKLHAKVTEMGMLELWCEGENEKKWKLEFNLRAENQCRQEPVSLPL